MSEDGERGRGRECPGLGRSDLNAGIRLSAPGAVHLMLWRRHTRTIVHDRILRGYVSHQSV